jgi:hypothetical protein
MRYSIYNYTTRTYDYYDGSGPEGAHAGAPQIAKARNQLGATPEQAAWSVPKDAIHVGTGDLPQGRIGTFDDKGTDMTKVVVLGAAALLAWRILR